MKITTDFYNKLFELELKEQEIHSNKRTLKGFLWFYIILAFIGVLTHTGFFEIDKHLVNVAIIATTLLFLPAIYLTFKGDLSKPWIKYFLLLILCIASGTIVSILSYHTVLAYVAPLLFTIQYRKVNVIWYVYFINVIVITISSLLSYYYGICDLNILLQSQHVTSWYSDYIVDGTLTLPLNENVNFIIIVFEAFPRSIIFLFFSIMMQYTVISNNRDSYRIAQLTHSKDTDSRTNLYNKNKYNEMLSSYYPDIANVAVLFWDLNNLKQINDEYGHANGDISILALANALRQHASDTCHIFRIGGDEFLMIIDNPDNNIADQIIASVKETLKKDTKDFAYTVSCAVGIGYGMGSDIVKVIEVADTNMYRNKKQIKETINQCKHS